MPLNHAKERVFEVLEYTIRNIRKNNGVLARTDEEKAALEAARKEAFAALVEEKFQELKRDKATNGDKSKYKNCSDADLRNIAVQIVKANNANILKNYINTLSDFGDDPELAKWAGYTYVEILELEASGVSIPEEVLAWAHAMQDNDETIYEEDGSTEDPGVESNENDLAKLKAKTAEMSKKSKNAKAQAEVKFQELNQIAERAEKIKKDKEGKEKENLDEISSLTLEWKELSDKQKNGEKLSDTEQKRYKELGDLLSGNNDGIVADIKASSDELDQLINSMDGLNGEVSTNIDLGTETIQIAEQLVSYGENSKQAREIISGQGAFDEVGKNIIEAKGGDIANNALDNANNLITFSNTVGSQLEMNQYASLYEFATMFTQDANSVLTETDKALEGSDIKEQEPEAQAEVQAQDGEKSDLDNLKELNESGIQLDEKVQKTGEESEKLAQEAENAVDEARQAKEAVEEKEEQVAGEQEAAQEEPKSIQEPENAENSENIENQENPEEVQEQQEQSEQPENTDKVTGLIEEINGLNGEIKLANTEGMAAKEKIAEFKNVNDDYLQFNDDAQDAFSKTSNIGIATTVYGTAMTLSGGQLLNLGAMLAIWQPVMSALMIAEGTKLLAAGIQFMQVGGKLIVTSKDGAESTENAGKTIVETDEAIQNASERIDNIDDAEGEESEAEDDENLTAAQKDRKMLEEKGSNIIQQAVFFTKKSGEQTISSVKGMGQLTVTSGKSFIEAKKSELTAKDIESKMSKSKAERDELADKKEKAEAQQEKLEKNPNAKISNRVEFTEEDQNKLDQLEDKLEEVGTEGQEKILASYDKVDGLAEALQEIPDGADTIDYGTIAQEIGLRVIAAFPPISYLAILTMFGVASVMAGTQAVVTGKLNEKAHKDTTEIVDDSLNTIASSQNSVEQTTGVSVGDITGEKGEEEQEENKEEAERAASGASAGPGIDKNNAASEGRKMQGTLTKGKDVIKGESKESVKNTKEGEKTQRQLEQELKNVQNTMKRETNKANKINNKVAKIVQEEMQLQEEALAIQAENEGLAAQQNNPSQPAPMTANAGNAQGGLLVSAAGGAANSGITSQIQANNERLDQIGASFSRYSRQIAGYDRQLAKIKKAIKASSKRFNNIAKERDKVVRQQQKIEQAKADKLQKRLDIIGLGTTIFSIISAIGTLLCATGFGASVGAVLVNIGLYGTITCGILKAAVLAASGDWKQALITLAMTAVTAAASMIGAGGAATEALQGAQLVMQVTSSSASIVSSGAQMVGQIQRLEGKEASAWTETVSQVAGAASALTGVAGGFVGGGSGQASQFANSNGFGKAVMIAKAVGTTMSTTAQMSTLIKQANGKDAGDFEKWMGTIGTAITAAASLAQLGQMAFGNEQANNSGDNEGGDNDAKGADGKTEGTDGKAEGTDGKTQGTGKDDKVQSDGADDKPQGTGNNDNLLAGSNDDLVVTADGTADQALGEISADNQAIKAEEVSAEKQGDLTEGTKTESAPAESKTKAELRRERREQRRNDRIKARENAKAEKAKAKAEAKEKKEMEDSILKKDKELRKTEREEARARKRGEEVVPEGVTDGPDEDGWEWTEDMEAEYREVTHLAAQSIRNERTERLSKISDAVGNAISGTSQTISSLASTGKDEGTNKTGSYSLKDYRRGRNLIKQVKRRYGAGNKRRYA